jgi:tocopherol O-methyltransferase
MSDGGKIAMLAASNVKALVRDHYDRLSPVYRSLWGEHIHHGYWIQGHETKELAQEQLVDLLANTAGIQPEDRVLDIGCGIGGTAVHLTEKYGVNVIGLTLSPVQAAMAAEFAAKRGVPGCSFVVMDAEEMGIRAKFDVIWSIEALSHMPGRIRVIHEAIALLKPGGTIALIDWFKGSNPKGKSESVYLEAVETSMLVPELATMTAYAECLTARGCRVTAVEDLTGSVSKTWDICAEFSRLPALWDFARRNGPEVLHFLRGLRLMKAAIHNRVVCHGLITAKKL